MFPLQVRSSFTQAPPTVVTVAGDIDIASVVTLRDHLRALPGDSTVMELSGVQLMSAAGARELAELRDRLTRAGAPLALAGAGSLVGRVLAITGLADTVILTDTVDAAIHLIARGSR
ncbi:STAS domain-containing protein [Pseudonocardia lacus]|uniref:STAS domain-containing protein n=1 Tax=Pseudonocardia lacus TaxID=2835865 RepID=UPI001BDD1683|nr:STAS domain-containing protein [Pseudonocardia lacus]